MRSRPGATRCQAAKTGAQSARFRLFLLWRIVPEFMPKHRAGGRTGVEYLRHAAANVMVARQRTRQHGVHAMAYPPHRADLVAALSARPLARTQLPAYDP